MSDLENKTQEETPKKRPYNLREKKEKKAAYRSLIRPELADELYDRILTETRTIQLRIWLRN